MNIDRLYEKIDIKNDVYIYGFGLAGKWIADNLMDKYNVLGFIDTDHKKTDKSHNGLKVITPNTAKGKINSNSIIVNTVIDIQDVVDILKTIPSKEVIPLGLYLSDLDINKFKNNLDELDSFIEYSLSAVKKCHEGYFNELELFLRSVDLVITEKCSLKCKDCSNLMQYYEKPENVDFEEIVHDFDLLLEKVNHIYEVRLIGGEPFMNKDIYKILDYLYTKDKISKIVVYSNAMIPIKHEYINILKNEKLVFSLTNYGELAKNTPKVIEQLEKLEVSYRLHEPENWTDSGTIKYFNRNNDELKSIFNDCCGKNLLTLSDNKLYRCPFAANADRLKAIPNNKLNYVALETAAQEDIKKYTRNIEFIPACNYCKGRSFNAPEITPAIQAIKPLEYKKFI